MTPRRSSSRLAARSAAREAAKKELFVDPSTVLQRLERTRARSHAAAATIVAEAKARTNPQVQRRKPAKSGRQSSRIGIRRTRSIAKRQQQQRLGRSLQRWRGTSLESEASMSGAEDAQTGKKINWLVEEMIDVWPVAIYQSALNEKGALDLAWLSETATVCKSFGHAVNSIVWSRLEIRDKAASTRLVEKLNSFFPRIKKVRRTAWSDPADDEIPLEYFQTITRVKEIIVGPEVFETRAPLYVFKAFPQATAIDIRYGPLHDWSAYPDHLDKILFSRVGNRASLARGLEFWRWDIPTLVHTNFAGTEPSDSRDPRVAAAAKVLANIEKVKEMHSVGQLRMLTKLAIDRMPASWSPTSHYGDLTFDPLMMQNAKAIPAFIGAIKALDRLRCLCLHRSTVSTGFLNVLPSSLQELELVDCLVQREIDAPLTQRGDVELKSLTLIRNNAFELEMLGHLQTYCPKLERLFVDLQDLDNEPDHIYWATPGKLIDWPQSLRELEIHHLKVETVDDLEFFLAELVAASDKLPLLRTLSLKMALDASWRTRAQLRETWTTILNHVFKRPETDPLPYSSLSQYENLFGASAQKAFGVVCSRSATTLPDAVMTEDSINGAQDEESDCEMQSLEESVHLPKTGSLGFCDSLLAAAGPSTRCSARLSDQSVSQASKMDKFGSSSPLSALSPLSSIHDVDLADYDCNLGSSWLSPFTMAAIVYKLLNISHNSSDVTRSWYRDGSPLGSLEPKRTGFRHQSPRSRFDEDFEMEPETGELNEAEWVNVRMLATPRQCTKVDFIIDNQKPAGMQFGMEDFLDDAPTEAEDDDDFIG